MLASKCVLCLNSSQQKRKNLVSEALKQTGTKKIQEWVVEKKKVAYKVDMTRN